MTTIRILASLFALTLASGVAGETLSQAHGSAAFEAMVIAPSTTAPSAFFRINTLSGQTQVVWGASGTFTAIIDPTPLPAGDYHIYGAAQPQMADGKVIWSLTRMDNRSGHTWVLSGCGPVACKWVDVAPAS